MFLTVLSGCACAAWIAVLLSPSQPHRTRERLEADVHTAPLEPRTGDASRALRAGYETVPDGRLEHVTVLIPARNEADVIGQTLSGLAAQGEGLRIVVVDDRSTDATADVCRSLAAGWERRAARGPRPPELHVIAGAEPPPGWSGKLWALEQGLVAADRPYTLLLDADIELAPGIVAALVTQAGERGAALVSLMATLRCRTFWERLLVPPFVYFFKLIYPFARVSSPAHATAAAAGGCILIETSVLRETGLRAIRGALIDDCALAGAVKRQGHRIWLGLSRSVRSLRAYPRLEDFAQMVRRTAFTQLRYSTWLLLGVTGAMLVLFAAPFAALVASPSQSRAVFALAALAAMYASFVPIVRFYSLNLAWVLSLPIAAALFLWMTWGSAVGYWCGTTAEWKNRAYAAK